MREERRERARARLVECALALADADAADDADFDRALAMLCAAADAYSRQRVKVMWVRREIPLCAGPGCARKARANGLCDSHYRQAQRGRELTPLPPRSESGLQLASPKSIKSAQAKLAAKGIRVEAA